MGRFTYEEIDEGEGTSDIVTYDSSRQDFGNHIYTENTTTFHPPIHHHPSDELDEGIASTVPYSSIMSPTSYHNRHDRIPQSICTQFGDDQTLNPTSNVYRSDDDFGEANRQRSNFNYYIKHGCIILIMLLLQHYIPPPPPPNHSWRDFVSNSTESFVTTVQSVIALTAYISSGCVHNIYGDVKTVISSAFTHNYHHHHHHTDTDTELSGNQGNNCRLFIPLEGSSSNVISDGTPNNNSINNSHLGENTNNDEDLVEYLLKTIHGQKEAINNTVKKLYQWNDKKKRQPLSILLTGSNGVGKYKTASQLAHYFLSQCGSNDNGEYYSPLSNGLLILSGLDYALENDLNQKDDLICHHQDIVPKILNYLYKRNGAPAVILIKHVENIAHSQQLELFRLLKQSKVKFQPVEMINKKSLKHDQGWRSLNQYANVDEGEETFVEINLENVAFIATSDEGTNKLFEVISKSDGIHDDMLYEEVNKSVQHEVNKVFGESVSDIVDLSLSLFVIPATINTHSSLLLITIDF